MSNNLTLNNSIFIILHNAHLKESPTTNPDNSDNEDRPDILFFSLLSLQDSIVNIKKCLNIYIITKNGTIIKVYNTFRVPRTYKLFLKVMGMLFNSTNKILKASDSEEVLLEILPGSISDHIPKTLKVNIIEDGYLINLRTFLRNRSHIINTNSITFYINTGPFTIPDNKECDYIEDEQITKREEYLLKLIEEGDPEEPEDEFNITISSINITASAKCYKLMCDIEAVFNL